MNELKQSVEDSFLESLRDLDAIMDKIGSHFPSIEALAASVKLALENNVHLALLVSLMAKGKR